MVECDRLDLAICFRGATGAAVSLRSLKIISSHCVGAEQISRFSWCVCPDELYDE